jgi:hypothetical protein
MKRLNMKINFKKTISQLMVVSVVLVGWGSALLANEYVHLDENESIFIGVEKGKMTVLHFMDEPMIEAKNPFQPNFIEMSMKDNRVILTPKSSEVSESFLVLGQSGTHYMIEMVSVSGLRDTARDAVKRIRRKDAVVDPSDKKMSGEKYFWEFAKAMIYGKIPPGSDAVWTLGEDSEDITPILKMNPDILEVKTLRKYTGPRGMVGIVAHAINKTDHPVRVLLPEINFRGFRAAHAYPKIVQPKGSTRKVYDRGKTFDVYTDTSVLYIIMEEGVEN